jgi:uncharacterized protein YlxW (UPF0749 family)
MGVKMGYVTKQIKKELYDALMSWCKDQKPDFTISFSKCFELILTHTIPQYVEEEKFKARVSERLAKALTEEERRQVIAEELERIASKYEELVKKYKETVANIKKQVEETLAKVRAS